MQGAHQHVAPCLTALLAPRTAHSSSSSSSNHHVESSSVSPHGYKSYVSRLVVGNYNGLVIYKVDSCKIQKVVLFRHVCAQLECSEMMRFVAEILDSPARSLVDKFMQGEGGTRQLDQALVRHRDALELRPQGHPDRSCSLGNLALCLSTR